MFTASNASAASAIGNAKLKELCRPKPIAQAVWIQDKLRERLEKPETSDAAIAQLARAWDVLEERKAILRGIGAPKPVPAANDPTNKPRAKPQTQSFSETGEGPEK